MSVLVNEAASVSPPVQESNLWVLSVTTSSVPIAIPTAWLDTTNGRRQGHWLTLQADGGTVYFALGSSTVVVDETAVSTVSSGAITGFDGDECWKIADGSSVDADLRRCGSTVTHFAIKGSAACKVRIVRSDGPTA